MSLVQSPTFFPAEELDRVRRDFPILSREVNGKPFIYFDNAASTMKPRVVTAALSHFYETGYANIHRGVHTLSQDATEAYEQARKSVAAWIEADSPNIVFTRNATESINLVASSWAAPRLRKGDRILLTAMEHHANIVPWQLLQSRLGVELDVVNVLEDGSLDREDFRRKLEHQPKLVALVHVSNALGTINPARELIEESHRAGAKVILDSAQALPHFDLSVKDLDCDFLVFSGHKIFGPTGIGVLYGKPELLEETQPYQGGGDMIREVHFAGTTFKAPPERFEAGTPHIAGAIGLATAIDYLREEDREAHFHHEAALVEKAEEALLEIPGIRILGQAPEKCGVVSFLLENVHPHDIGSFLDAEGVAIRTGHHCAQPLMDHFGLSGTARASFAFYNSPEEVDVFIEGIRKIRKFFG